MSAVPGQSSAGILPAKWLCCIVLALMAALLSWWPDGLALLRYDRIGLGAGQWWRALTAHLTHINTTHLMLNLAALFLLCELLWDELPARHGLGLLAAGAAATTLLLFVLDPQLGWYAGLSGALHGLWSGCALYGVLLPSLPHPPCASTPTSAWRRRLAAWPGRRRFSLAALVLLGIKLALESAFGASPQMAALIGADVVIQSHCYGALGGILYALALKALGRQR